MQLNKAFESMTMKSSAATGPTGTLNFHNALRLLVAKNAGDTNSQLGVLQANSAEPAQSFRQLETETYAASTKKICKLLP
jgi:hypothetical protein